MIYDADFLDKNHNNPPSIMEEYLPYKAGLNQRH